MLQAFADALRDVFLWAIPVVAVALAVSFFIREVPLKAREPASTDGSDADADQVALTH